MTALANKRDLVVKKFLSFTNIFRVLIDTLTTFFDNYRESEHKDLQRTVIREHRLLIEAVFEEQIKLTELYDRYDFDIKRLDTSKISDSLLSLLSAFSSKVDEVFENCVKISQSNLAEFETVKDARFYIVEIRSFIAGNFKQFVYFTGKIADQTSFKKVTKIHLPKRFLK